MTTGSSFLRSAALLAVKFSCMPSFLGMWTVYMQGRGRESFLDACTLRREGKKFLKKFLDRSNVMSSIL
jgi:hypothetical protein